MDESNQGSSHIGQAGAGMKGDGRDKPADDRRPTGQAGTGQSDDPGAPEDYDSDPQAGGGKLDRVDSGSVPATGGDAPSHGSR